MPMPVVDFVTTPSELEGAVLDRPGCPVHYWTAGPPDAVAVVLLPGATADHRMFNAQLPALLGAGYRVVVWDARGHGRSVPMPGTPSIDDYVDDLFALIAALALDRPVLVGQSLGSYIAQHAVRRCPDLARGLVVIGGIVTSMPVGVVDLAALRSTRAILRVWPWASFTRIAARQAGVGPATQAYLADCLAGLDRARFLRIWRAVVGAVGRRGFGAFPELPVVWLHGDQEPGAAIVRQARTLADRQLATVATAIVPDAGHSANQDNPEVVNAELLSFLARIAAG